MGQLFNYVEKFEPLTHPGFSMQSAHVWGWGKITWLECSPIGTRMYPAKVFTGDAVIHTEGHQ